MNENFVSATQGSYASNVAEARMLPVWLTGLVAFAILFALFLSTEYVYALVAAELALRGWDGVLTDGEATLARFIAAGFCALSVFLFHLGLRWLNWSPGVKTAIFLLVVTSAVVVSQPIIALLMEMPLGNSISNSRNGGVSLQNQLLTGGFVVRSVQILLAAMAASALWAAILKTASRALLAWQSRKNAVDLANAIVVFDDGMQEIDSLPGIALAHAQANAGDLARGLVAGRKIMARTVTQIINTGAAPFWTGPQWADQIQAQFEKTESPRDPEVSQMLRDRLAMEAIDLQALPRSAATLTPKARAELAKYAAWLYARADMNLILKEVTPDLEVGYA